MLRLASCRNSLRNLFVYFSNCLRFSLSFWAAFFLADCFIIFFFFCSEERNTHASSVFFFFFVANHATFSSLGLSSFRSILFYAQLTKFTIMNLVREIDTRKRPCLYGSLSVYCAGGRTLISWDGVIFKGHFAFHFDAF